MSFEGNTQKGPKTFKINSQSTKIKKPDYLFRVEPSESNNLTINIKYTILSQVGITEFKVKKLINKPQDKDLLLSEVLDYFSIPSPLIIQGKVRLGSIISLPPNGENPFFNIIKENGFPSRIIFSAEELPGPFLMTKVSTDIPDGVNHLVIFVENEEYAAFRLKFWRELGRIKDRVHGY